MPARTSLVRGDLSFSKCQSRQSRQSSAQSSLQSTSAGEEGEGLGRGRGTTGRDAGAGGSTGRLWILQTPHRSPLLGCCRGNTVILGDSSLAPNKGSREENKTPRDRMHGRRDFPQHSKILPLSEPAASPPRRVGWRCVRTGNRCCASCGSRSGAWCLGLWVTQKRVPPLAFSSHPPTPSRCCCLRLYLEQR